MDPETKQWCASCAASFFPHPALPLDMSRWEVKSTSHGQDDDLKPPPGDGWWLVSSAPSSFAVPGEVWAGVVCTWARLRKAGER